MLNAFKNSLSQSPINSAYLSKKTALNSNSSLNLVHLHKKTADSQSVRYDNSYTPNSFEEYEIQAFAAPLALHLSADGLNGNLFGFFAGASLYESDYTAQAQFAYAHGTSEQNLDTQYTDLKADLLQLAGFIRLFNDKMEADLSANVMMGLFDINNAWLANSSMNSNSNFNNYQGSFSTLLGYRFGEAFSVKPFVGAEVLFEKQDGFTQKNGTLNIRGKAYNELIIGGIIGVETRYVFENGAFVFAKASVENFNEEKNERFMISTLNGTEPLRYESYKNVINVNLGGRIFTKDFGDNSLKIDIEALYQHYDDNLNAFGGNVLVRWKF